MPKSRVLVGDQLDLEQVAGLGAFDVDRPGERMAAAETDAQQVRGGALATQLTVEPIARLERQFLAWRDARDREDSGMPAIVAGAGLLVQGPCDVDRDPHRGSGGSCGITERTTDRFGLVDHGRRRPR